MQRGLIIFDVDGVLVDVSESYRETIVRTVALFTGKTVSRERIQEYKNTGGWNNDWKLSHRIAADLGVEVPYEKVVEEFNKLFLGNNADGLILRERWIARPGVLERLNESFDFAIFTGRSRMELEPTLARCANGICFQPALAADDLVRHKPAPDGLLQIIEARKQSPLWYVGDTIDDARCAKAAGVPFIGVAAPGPWQEELRRLLEAEGAAAVIDDINSLEDAIAKR